MRSVRIFAIAVVAAMLVVVVPMAAADVGLTLSTSNLPGWHAVGAPVRTGRMDLAAGLARGPVAAIDNAMLQTSAAADGGGRVRSDAFVFGSASVARRVLSAWQRVHNAKAVKDGAISYLSARGRSRVVAWRDGARIGVIALEGTRDPGALALAYAVLADGLLRSPLPTTAWGRVLDQIGPNGTVSKRTALEAFAVVYGSLPGVHSPAGRRTTIPSGTLAAQWVLSYWRQLTSAQRRVVQRRLGVGPAGSLAHTADYGDPGFTPDPTIQVQAYKYVKIYQALLGHSLGLPVVAGKSTESSSAYADTTVVGDPQVCRIRVLPAGQQVGSQQNVEFVPPLDLILAHEVFHCFQGDITGWKTLPAWITEGMADWAALTVDPVSYFHGGGNLQTYINTPHTPLFERSYDAVGFWGHAEDVVPNLWASIPAILNVGSSQGALHLAGGDDDAFLTDWGSSVFRVSGSVPWEMQSPISPPSAAQLAGGRQTADLLVMPIVEVDAPPLTTSQYRVLGGPTEPVVHVSITGHARLSEHYNYTDLENAWFCMGSETCQCPKNTVGQVPPTLPLGNVTAFPLGLSGDSDTGTSGILISYPLSHFCKPVKQPPPPSGNQGGTGGSFGDPYITTFDGSRAGWVGYGLQTTGEFTLVKSMVDNLEIQARLQPFPGFGPFVTTDLAMNTAFAMRVGSSVVEVDNDTPEIFQSGALRLYLDHQQIVAPRNGQTFALPGGGNVRYTPSTVTVRWPDGTEAVVYRLLLHYGENISVQPSRGRAGLLAGLLGNDDGNPNNDFAGRNGFVYPAALFKGFGVDVGSPRLQHVVIGEFGASWRITPAASLFVYPPGKNTYSYIVKGFPRRVISLAGLSPRQRTDGLDACRQAQVTNAALLGGCAIDVGATGDRALAAAAGIFQRGAGLKPNTAKGPLSGSWSGRYSGAFQGTFKLEWVQSGSTLVGAIALSNPHTTYKVNGTVNGSVIRFGTVGSTAITYSGTVAGNTMSGTYNTPRGGGSWSATKSG
ncbi:MAG: hypothetical protein ACLP8S_06170 [Solirubrobacteraceae bacterium]